MLMRVCTERGWRALVTPLGSVVSDYEFDVIIGADGTRNTLEGKLAFL